MKNHFLTVESVLQLAHGQTMVNILSHVEEGNNIEQETATICILDMVERVIMGQNVSLGFVEIALV